MVQALVTALDPKTRPLAGGAPVMACEFKLDPTYAYDAGQALLESVEVSVVGTVPDDLPWPAIFVDVAGVETELTAQDAVAGSRRYDYPAGVPAFSALTHRFVFPGSAVSPPKGEPPVGRDAVLWQHGQVLVSVLRNALLVPGVATNPSFIYQTAWIGFTNPAVPLLRTDAEIVVGQGPSIEAGLAAALEQLIGTTGDTEFKFRVVCRYERQLVAAADGGGDTARLVAPLPVFYVPLATQTPLQIDAFASAAATQATAWIGQQAIVPGSGDRYVFDISVFANDDTQMARPLVELEGLAVAMPG
jgi:hypothetical protein